MDQLKDCNNNSLWCCGCSFCKRYFPEWTFESSRIVFWTKLIAIIVLVAIISVLESLDNKVWNDKKLTWETIVWVVVFNISLVYLIILYWPYQHKLAPMWIQVIIYLIWLFITVLFFANGFWLDLWHRPDVQNPAFDYWTIGHTLSGVVLGFTVPFWWMIYLTVIWEILEAYTVGLGDGESFENHIVDIIVAFVGWWFVILIFKKSRNDIPWISARNAVGNNGKCIYNVNNVNNIQMENDCQNKDSKNKNIQIPIDKTVSDVELEILNTDNYNTDL